MKARPVRNYPPHGYSECSVQDATHVTIHLPGPTGILTLPIMLKGTREGTNNWTWNGSINSPSLMPSVLTEGSKEDGSKFRCHSWIMDGKVVFLDDCTHEHKNCTVDLIDLPVST